MAHLTMGGRSGRNPKAGRTNLVLTDVNLELTGLERVEVDVHDDSLGQGIVTPALANGPLVGLLRVEYHGDNNRRNDHFSPLNDQEIGLKMILVQLLATATELGLSRSEAEDLYREVFAFLPLYPDAIERIQRSLADLASDYESTVAETNTEIYWELFQAGSLVDRLRGVAWSHLQRTISLMLNRHAELRRQMGANLKRQLWISNLAIAENRAAADLDDWLDNHSIFTHEDWNKFEQLIKRLHWPEIMPYYWLIYQTPSHQVDDPAIIAQLRQAIDFERRYNQLAASLRPLAKWSNQRLSQLPAGDLMQLQDQLVIELAWLISRQPDHPYHQLINQLVEALGRLIELIGGSPSKIRQQANLVKLLIRGRSKTGPWPVP